MEKWKHWLLAGLFAWVIPWITVSLLQPEQVPEFTETTAAAESKIWVQMGETRVYLPLETYVAGVVAAEMPESFQKEALMAQAVVARTYALRTALYGDKHPGAVCTDSACCQSWTDPTSTPWARQAADATADMVLVYGGQLIDAVYFSCSGGRTEQAVAVWGGDVPYLQSVESPGEEGAAHYRDEEIWLESEFLSALGLTGPLRLGKIRYTDGGGVDTMVICSQVFTGVQLRSLLGLRSTAMTLIPEVGQVRIITRGFGHRVGMSQYGAQAMAMGGNTFEQILVHYYPGTDLADSESFLLQESG